MPKTVFAASGVLQYSGFLNLYQTFAPTGNVWYVDSVSGTDSTTPTGQGKSPDAPFQTLQYAHDQAVSNNDDWIMIAQRHTENVGSAGAITISKNGLTIVGKGWGSSRPTFTWSATGGTFLVSGTGNRIMNLRCTCSIDEVVKLFSITGAYNCLDGIDYFETATFQAIQFVLVSSAGDDFIIRNCRHQQVTAAASAQKWIEIAGADRVMVERNSLFLTLNNAAGSVSISISSASLDSEIAWNTISQKGGTSQLSGILVVDSSTGTFAHDNRVAVGSTALPGIVDVGNAGYAAENYALNNPDKSGLLDPVVDA